MQRSEQELRDRAIERIKDKQGFYAHLLAYVLVNALIIAIWAMAGGGFFWPMFAILGWGIGIAFHWYGVFVEHEPTEEDIQREIRRSSEHHVRPARPGGPTAPPAFHAS
jgi:hypothetical protein